MGFQRRLEETVPRTFAALSHGSGALGVPYATSMRGGGDPLLQELLAGAESYKTPAARSALMAVTCVDVSFFCHITVLNNVLAGLLHGLAAQLRGKDLVSAFSRAV